MRADGVRVAGELVAECFPDARAAWLGGSIVRGDATSSSDLDITVLTQGRPAPYRHSVHYREWPVELFVHTESSLSYYCGMDQQRRQPTMMRLVAESVVHLRGDPRALRWSTLRGAPTQRKRPRRWKRVPWTKRLRRLVPSHAVHVLTRQKRGLRV
ncbi:MAG: nucleotidyltransferase domain-containing protein [Nocardioidaceae bacterium]